MIVVIFIGIIIFRLIRVDIFFILLDYFVEFVFDRVGKVMDVNSCRYIENSIKCIIFMCIIDRVVFCEGIDVLYFCINILMIIFIKSRRCM